MLSKVIFTNELLKLESAGQVSKIELFEASKVSLIEIIEVFTRLSCKVILIKSPEPS